MPGWRRPGGAAFPFPYKTFMNASKASMSSALRSSGRMCSDLSLIHI